MIRSKIDRSIAGLQAGMFGGMALLAVMVLLSMLDRQAWWSYPNLIAATFYGSRSLASGPGWPTVSGIALQLLIAAIAGALFGALFGAYGRSRRIALIGLIWGVFLFYASSQLYGFIAPLVTAYLPRNAWVVAHMIYGVCLAGIGRIGALHASPPPPAPQTPEGGMPVAPEQPEPAPLIAASSDNYPELALDAGHNGDQSVSEAARNNPV